MIKLMNCVAKYTLFAFIEKCVHANLSMFCCKIVSFKFRYCLLFEFVPVFGMKLIQYLRLFFSDSMSASKKKPYETTSTSTEAQKRFSNAKSISSDAYFGKSEMDVSRTKPSLEPLETITARNCLY